MYTDTTDAPESIDVELTEFNGRPEACECGDFETETDLPCWPCYRDGFETPADSTGE